MTGRVDVAVVGSGAAGIAAARQLAGLQHSVLLIEAMPRLGGRAHTATFDGLTLDLGCGWLHSARRNPLAALAQAQRKVLDRSPSVWHRQLRNLHFPPEAQRQAWQAYRQLSERLHREPPRSDCAGDAVARDDPWRAFIDGVSSFVNGAELDQLSVRDYLAYEDASTDDNWRLPTGYGAFIAAQAAALSVALATQVSSIALDDDITLATNHGSIHARAVIVAVSTAVLARGDLRFTPTVDDHLQAASCLPLGIADKVYLSLAERDAVPPESHLLGRIDSAATGSYYLRPFGLPVIECFLGGACARGLEKLGSDAAFAFVIDELKGLLGAEFARGLAPITATRWRHEPTIGGAYSHALPRHADARRVLATPVNERLCFAGEACSRTDFSTAHGAWQSGIDAAAAIDRYLRV